MKILCINRMLTAFGLAAILVAAGCYPSSDSEFSNPDPSLAERNDDHDHSHAVYFDKDDDDHHPDGHDHDHDHHGHHDDDHGHHHDPVHGGTLLTLGDHLGHLEFVLDENAGTLTMYALDDEVETGVRLRAESIPVRVTPGGGGDAIDLELHAVANVLTGETVGDTSEFAAANDALVGVEHVEVEIPDLEFLGQEFTDVKLPFPEGIE